MRLQSPPAKSKFLAVSMNIKHTVLTLSAFAASFQFASAATIFQVDLQRSGSPASQESQAGWTAWDVTKTDGGAIPHVPSVTSTIAGIGITITANGAGGRVTPRGGSPDDRGGEITGTSWDDMVEDFVIVRNGDDTATVSLTNLNSSLSYSLTVFHNEPYVLNAGFSGGTQTPSITTGTLVSADAGLITNVQPGARSDGDFDTSVITFTPDGGGAASILYSSSTDFIVFGGLELNSIPEPSTSLLAAVAGLALIRRRCR